MSNEVLFLIASAIIGLKFFSDWIMDLFFYWRRNWDFSLESGRNVYFGNVPRPGAKLSNRVRVLFVSPLVSFFAAIAFVVTYGHL